MKKILMASLLAMSAQFAFAANEPTPKVDPALQKVESYIQQKDFSAAFKELESISKTSNPNPKALYLLGYLSQMGLGTKQDSSKAVEYFKQASDKGDQLSSYLLAVSYQNGELNLQKSIANAKTYMEKAAKQGFPNAEVDLAMLYFSENKEESNKKALSLLDGQIAKGNESAKFARALYDINHGLTLRDEKMIKAGLNTIEAQGRKGYNPALLEIADMMIIGDLIQQDIPEAKRILTALAAQNVPLAQKKLAALDQILAEQNKTTAKPAPAKKGK